MKPSTTMDSLRRQGYKIKITHFRVTNRGVFTRRQIDEDNDNELIVFHHIIRPTGGKVTCEIEAPNGLRSEGVSVVSKKDNFKKGIGTAMAFGRAWKPFTIYGKSALSGYPIGSDIVHRTTGKFGSVMGCRVITLRKPRSMFLLQYVVTWNDDLKKILCVDEDEIELAVSKAV